MSTNNSFFTPFDENDKRTNIVSVVSAPLWSNGVGTLTTQFYTSSVQSASSGDYYYDVYDKVGTDTSREVQFAVAYGHVGGSGSKTTSVGNNPSKAIYSQFRNICLPANQTKQKFNFDGTGLDGTGTEYRAHDIFVISVNRARYREKMDPGNWELQMTGSAINVGVTSKLHLIDDSRATSDSSVKASHRVFNVVSGSIAGGGSGTIKTPAIEQVPVNSAGSYGLFFPELGTIVLNAYAISKSLGIAVGRHTSNNNNNSFTFFRAIDSGSYFRARREEQIKSSHYFCRIRSDEYNFSQNPTYYSGSSATLTNPTFIANPKSYITTVGLYNTNNDLLAVAKLSKPLLKSSDREAVIKVRLDF